MEELWLWQRENHQPASQEQVVFVHSDVYGPASRYDQPAVLEFYSSAHSCFSQLLSFCLSGVWRLCKITVWLNRLSCVYMSVCLFSVFVCSLSFCCLPIINSSCFRSTFWFGFSCVSLKSRLTLQVLLQWAFSLSYSQAYFRSVFQHTWIKWYLFVTDIYHIIMW